MGKARLPWKRGPAAWRVKCHADEILEQIGNYPRQFLSLRRAARLLGVSTQPLREWSQRGYLERTGRKRRIDVQELKRLVEWLVKRAQPYDWSKHRQRLCRRRDRPPYRFEKLSFARFKWPKDCSALRPVELARLIGCHPSLVVKAIQIGRVRGRRRTPFRWEITHRAWKQSFYFSLITPVRFPPLPAGELISTRTAAKYLRACGLDAMTPTGVRQLIREGDLEAVHRPPEGRNYLVRKSSLREFRKQLAETP